MVPVDSIAERDRLLSWRATVALLSLLVVPATVLGFGFIITGSGRGAGNDIRCFFCDSDSGYHHAHDFKNGW
jgi:hypothetical protein